MKDTFMFHVPVSIIKAGEGESQEMRIGGIASTDHRDFQEETLLNGGFDLTYLKAHGFINWHHQLKNNPAALIGVPDRYKTCLMPEGLYVEAVLYPSDMGKAAYAQTLVMEENAHLGRKMGWSIEGKVTERDPLNPKIVRKAQITGVALTPMPINPNTFAQVIKAFVDGDSDGIDKGGTVSMDTDKLIAEHKKLVNVLESDSHTDDKEEAKEQKKELEEYMMEQAFGDGAFVKCRTDGTIMVNLGKAMTLGAAAAVMPESLDKKIRNETYGEDVKKALLCDIFRVRLDLTPEQALGVMDRLLKGKELKESQIQTGTT